MASRWGNLPPFGKAPLTFAVLVTAFTMLVADKPLAQWMLLAPSELWHGRLLWTPLTCNFIFPNDHAGYVLMTIALQWFLGSRIETHMGTPRYTMFCLVCGSAGYAAVLALVPWLPAQTDTLGGTTAMDLAAVVAFGVLFARERWGVFGVFSIDGRWLALVIVGLTLLGPLATLDWPMLVPWLVAMLLALLWTLEPWRRGRLSGKLRRTRARHLKVVAKEEVRLLN